MAKRKSPSELVDSASVGAVEIKLAKANAEVRSLKRRHKETVRLALESQARLDAVLGFPGDIKTQVFSRKKSKSSDGVAVVVPASDWHVDEQVFPKAVNGKNEFNVAIAEKRIRRLYVKTLELIDWQSVQQKVVEIWHPLLGDLISGYIHEELMESNTMSPTQACIFVQEMICSGIDFWLSETKLPIFVSTCCGNHGRTTVRKRIKTSYMNSFEWLLYVNLAKYYRNEPRVTWMIGEGYQNICEIMGRKVRFHHGDGMRYAGGVGGITIPVNKAIAQYQKLEACDFDIFGHWHQFNLGFPHWVCCPCLIGYSEFALEIRAEFQHPAQAFVVIDREYGIVEAKPIFLTDPWCKQKRRKK